MRRALEVGLLAIHERGEIRALESVKIVGRGLGNSVAPEERVVEEQTALYEKKTLDTSSASVI